MAIAPGRARLPVIASLIGIVVLGGVVAALAFQRLHSPASPSAGTPGVGLPGTGTKSLPRRVAALGRLEPAGTVLLIASRSGNDGTRVEQLRVREGEDVTAGQVLAILDNEPLRKAALAEATARLESAQARLDQVQAGAKAGDIAAQRLAAQLLSVQQRVVERELQRARDLQAQGIVAREDLEAKQWAFDRVVLEQQRAEELLKSIQDVREIDVRVAQRDVSIAAATVQRAQVELDATRICAPSAGRILKIHAHQGERLGDQGVLEMGDVQNMEAVAEVFEADVAAIHPGCPALVKVDALSEPLHGTVAEIGHRVGRKVVLTNDPVSDTDARVVEVRIRLSADDVERVVRLSNARVQVTIELPELSHD